MQQSSPVLQQLRALHPNALHTLHQSPDGSIFAQNLPELQNLQATADVFNPHQQYALTAPPPQPPPHAIQYEQHALPPSAQFPPFPVSYQNATSPRFAVTHGLPLPAPPPQQYQPSQPPPPRPTQQIPLPPPIHTAQQPISHQDQHGKTPVLQSPDAAREAEDNAAPSHGQFDGLKLIEQPPNLEEWREKLFNVDETITLTEAEFQTYFPHIDNVYSHRSTQRHKRKRFVSHYWDCRLKGRPPGTKKSTDPEKKKRKRVARERDLCDVKIKITEFWDVAEYEEQMGHRPPGFLEETANPGIPSSANVVAPSPQEQAFFGQQPILGQPTGGGWDMSSMGQSGVGVPFTPGKQPMPRNVSKKFYTFQRVNGNGGNGKTDGIAGPHKHTLEASDRVKKNSVLRWLAKCEKDERKKSTQAGDSTKKTYHKRATGLALQTVKAHAKDDPLKLYGSCFCPFVQRVWIALEHKRIPYQYIEVDPYRKPQSLLDVNPRGLVPALRHGPSWSTHESTVIMEYLEDLNEGPALLPPSAQDRATSRLWADHINRNVIPLFYKLLQAQDTEAQINHATELRTQLSPLLAAAHPTGPFFLGPTLSFVDAQFAPWMLRFSRVLGPYRGWPAPEEGSRWKAWVDAVESEKSVRATTSGDELYIESYERYAENRPGTSQVADAVNSGRGLP